MFRIKAILAIAVKIVPFVIPVGVAVVLFQWATGISITGLLLSWIGDVLSFLIVIVNKMIGPLFDFFANKFFAILEWVGKCFLRFGKMEYWIHYAFGKALQGIGKQLLRQSTWGRRKLEQVETFSKYCSGKIAMLCSKLFSKGSYFRQKGAEKRRGHTAQIREQWLDAKILLRDKKH